MSQTPQQNQLAHKYALADIRYANTENTQQTKTQRQKDFIMAMKYNRKVALRLEDKQQGHFVIIDSLRLEQGTTQLVYLKGLDFPVLLSKQVFKNKDDGEGILYLVGSDLNLIFDQIATIYQKLWNVEVFHGCIGSNICLFEPPIGTLQTRSDRVFASILAAFELGTLRLRCHVIRFALGTKFMLGRCRLVLLSLKVGCVTSVSDEVPSGTRPIDPTKFGYEKLSSQCGV